MGEFCVYSLTFLSNKNTFTRVFKKDNGFKKYTLLKAKTISNPSSITMFVERK